LARLNASIPSRYGVRVWTLVGEQPDAMCGTDRLAHVWESQCVICGASYTVPILSLADGSRRETASSFATMTCPEHRGQTAKVRAQALRAQRRVCLDEGPGAPPTMARAVEQVVDEKAEERDRCRLDEIEARQCEQQAQAPSNVVSFGEAKAGRFCAELLWIAREKHDLLVRCRRMSAGRVHAP
jgi:hypothetical protein